MSDIHVDEFFKDAARALTLLYANFPRRQPIFVEDVCGPQPVDEFGLHSDRHQACLGTLIWLGEEGLLRHEGLIRQEAIDQAVLSSRCFTLLSTPALRNEPRDVTDLPPLVREERATNIHRLRSALKERSSARLRAAMMDLLSVLQR